MYLCSLKTGNDCYEILQSGCVEKDIFENYEAY